MKLQTQLETLENRANELRTKRDDAGKVSAKLDARLTNGEFDRAGEAANKRAELDAINRALESVERDADAVRGQIAEQGAAAAYSAEIERLQNMARDILTIEAEAQEMARQLASHIEIAAQEITEKRAQAGSLRVELRRSY